MSKVIKRAGLFELEQDPAQLELSAAKAQHAVELELLSNSKPDAAGLSIVIYHLLLRIRALPR